MRTQELVFGNGVSMNYTIKQIAEQVGVSKQAVRNNIEKLGLQNKLQKKGNTLFIDEKTANELIGSFVQNETKSKSTTVADNTLQQVVSLLTDQVAVLTEQLAVKDKQIEELNNRLAEANELNKNNQILIAKEQQPLLPEQTTAKAHWWQRKKKRKEQADE